MRQSSVNKDTVKSFLKNPIGLIGLIASIFESIAVILFSIGIEKLNGNLERQPIIWFIVGFPIFVLGVITYLIVNHNLKLYGPGDYSGDMAFLKANDKELNAEKQYEAKLLGLTDNTSVQKQGNTKSNGTDLIVKSEAIGLSEASNYFGISLRKDVRLKKRDVSKILFDGMAFKGDVLCVAEVKLISEKNWMHLFSLYLAKMSANITQLQKAGYNIEALLVLVPKGEISQQTQMSIEEKFYSESHDFGLKISNQTITG